MKWTKFTTNLVVKLFSSKFTTNFCYSSLLNKSWRFHQIWCCVCRAGASVPKMTLYVILSTSICKYEIRKISASGGDIFVSNCISVYINLIILTPHLNSMPFCMKTQKIFPKHQNNQNRNPCSDQVHRNLIFQ